MLVPENMDIIFYRVSRKIVMSENMDIIYLSDLQDDARV